MAWAGAALFLARASFAADVSESDRTTARTLFTAGRTLAEQGDYQAACPKFEESLKIDPGIGTRFNLADCLEHIGRTASAWSGFLEVANASKAAGQFEREKVARERAAALDSKVPRLTIDMSALAGIQGVHLTKDGVDVGTALWGVPLPVDPGPSRLEVRAPGREPWQVTALVGADAAPVLVRVPLLNMDAPAPVLVPPGIHRAEPSAGSAAGAVDEASDVGRSRRVAALAVGGVGVAALAVGAGYGVRAMTKQKESLDECDPNNENRCSAAGVSLRETAQNAATISTIAVGAGLATVVAGAVLWLTAPSAAGGEAKTGRIIAVPTVQSSKAAAFLVRLSF